MYFYICFMFLSLLCSKEGQYQIDLIQNGVTDHCRVPLEYFIVSMRNYESTPRCYFMIK